LEQLYGGDKSVLGRDLRISGRPFTIVGVMAPNFNLLSLRCAVDATRVYRRRETLHHSNNWFHIGRLKPGGTPQQLSTSQRFEQRKLERMPELKELLINAGFHTVVKPLQTC